jgi:hypothetical protein
MKEIDAEIELALQIDAGADLDVLTKNHKSLFGLFINNEFVWFCKSSVMRQIDKTLDKKRDAICILRKKKLPLPSDFVLDRKQ